MVYAGQDAHMRITAHSTIQSPVNSHQPHQDLCWARKFQTIHSISLPLLLTLPPRLPVALEIQQGLTSCLHARCRGMNGIAGMEYILLLLWKASLDLKVILESSLQQFLVRSPLLMALFHLQLLISQPAFQRTSLQILQPGHSAFILRSLTRMILQDQPMVQAFPAFLPIPAWKPVHIRWLHVSLMGRNGAAHMAPTLL